MAHEDITKKYIKYIAKCQILTPENTKMPKMTYLKLAA